MTFLKAINDELYNKVLTENGDTAYASTGSHCLNYFAAIGGLRNNAKESFDLFLKAYREDPHMALKILFYSRDILEGLGERHTFRLTLNIIANFYPNVAEQLIPYIVKYGRYDDLLSYLMTASQSSAIEAIKKQLESDIEHKKHGEAISLLPKWLPSINASNSDARLRARVICQGLGMNYKEYRKMLSFLRKDTIIENNLREKAYNFDYNHVPSQALLKYQNAFITHDNERYMAFIHNDKTVIKTTTLAPYQLVREVFKGEGNEDVLNKTWESFDRSSFDSKTMVVLDGSGSMYSWEPSSEAVAMSLALFFAEQLKGEFHNTFMTFGAKPRLVQLKEDTFVHHVRTCMNYNDCSNTNLEAVYNLIYDVVRKKMVAPEEMIERLVIISDMEFDMGVMGVSTLETFKEKYEALGYKLPEIVFWNVAARRVHFPTSQNEEYIKLVSGFSQHVMDDIMSNQTSTPYEFMIECLKRYSDLDNVVIK